MSQVFKAFLLILLFILSYFVLFAQQNKQVEYNPEKLLEESSFYEDISNEALSKANIYQKEGTLYLDSAKFVSNVLKNNPPHDAVNYYMNKFESHYVMAYSLIALADSMAIIAENFREISIEKTKEAFSQMGKEAKITYVKHAELSPDDFPKNTTHYVEKSVAVIKDESSVNVNRNEIKETIYILQMGAGKMNMNYFCKLPEIKEVKCKDGVSRYIIPEYFTKSEAYKKKSELNKLGYEQIFVRTKESLDKIAY